MFDKILKLLKTKNSAIYAMLCITLALVILCIITGVAACNNCGGCASCNQPEPDNEKSYLNIVALDRGEGAPELKYDAVSRTYTYTVGVDEKTLDLSTFFTSSDSTVWTVYADIMGTTEISTKILANFENGANDYYVVVKTLDQREMRIFTLNVYKEYEVSVKFIGLNGTLLPSDASNMLYNDVVENVYQGSWAEDGVITFPGDTVLSGEGQAYPAYAPVGYTFNGWKVNGETVGNSYELKADVEFVADLTAKQYEVSLDVNGGNALALDKLTVTFGTEFDVEVPVREGYTFMGWQDNNANQITGNDGKSITAFDKEYAQFTAKWQINKYQIYVANKNYEAGSVTGQGEYKTYDYGTEITLTAIENEGYTFLGWFEVGAELPVSTEKEFTFNVPASDLNYEARWALYEIKVTVSDTSAGSVTGAGYYTAGTAGITLTAITNPTYTFLGWFEGSQNVCREATYVTVMPNSDLVLQAKWTRLKVEIEKSHEAEGNSVTGAGYYSKGDSYTLKAVTGAEGYEFVGWFASSDATEALSTSAVYTAVMGAEDVSVYAKWKIVIQTITVTFNSDGGSAVEPKQVTTFNENVALGVPTKTGYKFQGWMDGSELITGADGILGKSQYVTPVTLKAKWEAVVVNVTLNANGGQIEGGVTKATLTYGLHTHLPVASGKTGYEFAGWMDGATLITGADGGLNQASSYADDTKTVTLTAKWNAKTIIITYDTVEANAVITSNQQIVRYDDVNVQLLIPQLLDKGFDGWLLNGVEFTDASAILDKVDFVDNITLTAKWGDRVANFTYNTEAGVSGLPTTPVRVELGDTVTLAIPVKEGHTFKGWYRSDTFEDEFKITGADAKITNSTFTGSMVIYAKWETNSYLISITSNSSLGTVQGAGSYLYDTELTVKATAGEGCVFLGWYVGEELKSEDAEYTFTVKSALSLTAKFKNEYESIKTADDLKNIKYDEDYILEADINLNGSETNPWTPLIFEDKDGNTVGFKGRLIGNGKTISGLYINSYTLDNVGLFELVEAEGVIEGVTIVSPVLADVSNKNVNHATLSAGVIAGRNNGLITGCKVKGASITVAKKAGFLNPEHVKVGGIVGENASGAHIYGCQFDGKIRYGTKDAPAKTTVAVGGIAGYNGYYDYTDKADKPGSSGSIKAVFANVDIVITNEIVAKDTYVGGIVGYNRALVSDVYVNGRIYATSVAESGIDSVCVGGVVGSIWSSKVNGESWSKIIRAKASCEVVARSNTGNPRAGLVVGDIMPADSTIVYIEDVYADGEVIVEANVKNPLAGYIYGKNPINIFPGMIVINDAYYWSSSVVEATKAGNPYGITANSEAQAKSTVDEQFFTDTLGFGKYVSESDRDANPDNVWVISGSTAKLYFE